MNPEQTFLGNAMSPARIAVLEDPSTCPKTALCAVPAITLKLFVVIIRAINRQKARYLWLFASKWQSTVQVEILWWAEVELSRAD